MRKIIGILMTIIMAMGCVSLHSVGVMAEEIIPVYLNGEQIVFDSNDAQPQIFSQRTYVPIRRTAESLGLSIDWNAKTETLTFTREGVTIAHTMRSNIVYVNGNPVKFDTKSINKNNRTLMPVRMLAESIGADVQWDNAKRCVYIVSDTPNIVSASASQTIVASGTEITLTAVATGASTVKIVDAETNKTVGEINNYTEATDGKRTFTCKVTPVNATDGDIFKTYYIYPGNSGGYIESLESYGKVTVMVSAENATTTEATTETTTKDKEDDLGVQGSYKSDHMVSIKINKKNFELDENAQFTIKTDDEVKRVKITNSFNDKEAVASNYEEDGDEREFTVKTKLSKAGTVKLYVTLALEKGGYEDVKQTVTVKVVDEDDDSETEYGELEIIDIETPDEDVYKGENVRVVIYTSTDIREIAIYNSDEERMCGTAVTSKKFSNKYKWVLNFEMDTDENEKFTVYAYDGDDNQTKDTFKISGASYYRNSLVLLNVLQKTNDVEEGEECKLVVRTTKTAEKVVVKTKNGSELGTGKASTTSSGVKEWKVTIEARDADTTYVAYCYDSEDNSDNRKFTLNVSEAELPEINSVDVSDSVVDEDESVQVTVRTNKIVEKVWIEDAKGDRVDRVTKPDDETSNEYVWELEFDAEKAGRRVSYVVIAEGEDDETDEYDFTIKVND